MEPWDAQIAELGLSDEWEERFERLAQEGRSLLAEDAAALERLASNRVSEGVAIGRSQEVDEGLGEDLGQGVAIGRSQEVDERLSEDLGEAVAESEFMGATEPPSAAESALGEELFDEPTSDDGFGARPLSLHGFTETADAASEEVAATEAVGAEVELDDFGHDTDFPQYKTDPEELAYDNGDSDPTMLRGDIDPAKLAALVAEEGSQPPVDEDLDELLASMPPPAQASAQFPNPTTEEVGLDELVEADVALPPLEDELSQVAERLEVREPSDRPQVSVKRNLPPPPAGRFSVQKAPPPAPRPARGSGARRRSSDSLIEALREAAESQPPEPLYDSAEASEEIYLDFGADEDFDEDDVTRLHQGLAEDVDDALAGDTSVDTESPMGEEAAPMDERPSEEADDEAHEKGGFLRRMFGKD